MDLFSGYLYSVGDCKKSIINLEGRVSNGPAFLQYVVLVHFWLKFMLTVYKRNNSHC